jgi:hypothetical protein
MPFRTGCAHVAVIDIGASDAGHKIYAGRSQPAKPLKLIREAFCVRRRLGHQRLAEFALLPAGN